MRGYQGRVIFAALVAVFLFGCDASSGTSAPPKLADIQTTIFKKSCVFSPCHKGPSGAGGLVLDGTLDEVFTALVNAPTQSVKDKIRVVPDSPDTSYLVEKITRTEAEKGSAMPIDVVSAEKIESIKAWIRAGAKKD